jgi:hypothetical protein
MDTFEKRSCANCNPNRSKQQSQKAFADSFYAYLQAIFLEASIAIGNRFYPFLSCFLLAAHSALASMFESTS